MDRPTLRIARAPGYAGPLPAYQTEGAAGLDLHAAAPRAVYPDRVATIPTGIMVEIPPGFVGMVVGRSGLSKRGMHVIPGTIDSDYRGEISILATAIGESHTVAVGDRVAQILILPVTRCEVMEVTPAELTPTERGAGGFGSTGVL